MFFTSLLRRPPKTSTHGSAFRLSSLCSVDLSLTHISVVLTPYSSPPSSIYWYIISFFNLILILSFIYLFCIFIITCRRRRRLRTTISFVFLFITLQTIINSDGGLYFFPISMVSLTLQIFYKIFLISSPLRPSFFG